MTAPRSAGRSPKVPRHYVFRCASDVADWPIWLGNCPRGALRDRRSKPDRTEKWAGGNITLVLQYVLDLTLPDGQDMQCLWGIVFFCSRSLLAERNENRKNQPPGHFGRPSGMRGGGGRGYGEGQRSAKSEMCNFVIVYLSSCDSDLARQLLSTTRAADRYVHTAGPGWTPPSNFSKFGRI